MVRKKNGKKRPELLHLMPYAIRQPVNMNVVACNGYIQALIAYRQNLVSDFTFKARKKNAKQKNQKFSIIFNMQ